MRKFRASMERFYDLKITLVCVYLAKAAYYFL